MPETPLSLLQQGPAKAVLEIVEPPVDDPLIPIRFNPTEYQLQKTNNFAEIAIPGLESPPLQFIRGAAEKLSLDLLVDTTDTLEDVREKYTDKLRGLMRINDKLHAPPIVRFSWDQQVFVGVVESLTVTFQLFTEKGIPLRAKLSLSLKEYRPAAVQIKETKKQSPNVEKAYTVKRGDTLSAIAGAVYRDPTRWRVIAAANGIQDPRDLEPGTALQIPKLV
jgi:Contractile injection system tube protein/LysM domain